MELDEYGQIIDDALDPAFHHSNGMNDSILNNWLNPGYQQKREFGQQVALTKMQQDWAIKGKMAVAKEVGINPHTMAEGIAGAGASTAGAPNSAVGQGAAGIGSAAQAAGAVSGAVDSGINAYEKLSLTSVEKEKRSAETVAALQAAGLSYWEAKAIETLLPDRQKNLQADTYLKVAQFDKTTQEYQNLIEEKKRIQADIDRIKEQENLYRKQGNLADAEKLRVDAQTKQIDFDNWWKEQDKQFWLEHGYRQDDPLDLALRNAAANGKNEAADAVGKAIEETEYRKSKGKNAAEIEDAYQKYVEQFKAQADVDAEFAEFYSAIRQNELWIKGYIETVLNNGGDIGSLYNRLVSMIAAALDVDFGAGDAREINYRKFLKPKRGRVTHSDRERNQ